jgi:1-acyl-sn-glycerol-3-phosphate acyltransferase
MSATWAQGGPPPAPPRRGPGGLLRIAVKAPAMLAVLGIGLLVLLMLRLLERPLYGLHRPASPYVTVAVCRLVLRIIGLRVSLRGPVMRGPGAIVANHASWLDIFVLNSLGPVYFVSKAEVARWPGIGWLARATGTVFINRDRREAQAQTQLFQDRLMAGHRLLFFPEGTSTDGLQVLPFKTTLFAAFLAEPLRARLQVQAMSVTYHAPEGTDPRFYGWWGAMDFGPSLLTMLAQRRHGRVELVRHAPLKVAEIGDRKALAQALEAQCRAGHRAG